MYPAVNRLVEMKKKKKNMRRLQRQPCNKQMAKLIRVNFINSEINHYKYLHRND